MDELRQRLQRLGVTSGRNFKASPRPARRSGDIHELVDGETTEAASGSCFVVRRTYEHSSRHGELTLGEWLAHDPATAAALGDERRLALTEPGRYVFLDTETTGLGGGAFAFLVGIGVFTEEDTFEVRQFFLRDPADETAMLALLAEYLQPKAALVTFNGRSFDVPLLAARYVMSRQRSQIAALPNLDLLHPARRLWRRRLDSCALGSLETSVLGLNRTHEDVPGSLIPTLYRQYLQTRSAHEMTRVLYHNEIDILSMVTLGTLMLRAFSQPDAPDLHVDDRISLARWYERQGMLHEAEMAYTRALDDAPDSASRYDALLGMGLLLKRADRRAEAVALWEYLADLKLDVRGHEELAKYYEWHARDLEQALAWTDAGLRLAASWRPGWRRTEAVRELDHRRERLLHKLQGNNDALSEEDEA